jgi:hypothetical protein
MNAHALRADASSTSRCSATGTGGGVVGTVERIHCGPCASLLGGVAAADGLAAADTPCSVDDVRGGRAAPNLNAATTVKAIAPAPSNNRRHTPSANIIIQ